MLGNKVKNCPDTITNLVADLPVVTNPAKNSFLPSQTLQDASGSKNVSPVHVVLILSIMSLLVDPPFTFIL